MNNHKSSWEEQQQQQEDRVKMLKKHLIIIRRIKLQKLKSVEREMEPLRNAIVCSGSCSNRDRHLLQLLESNIEYLKSRKLPFQEEEEEPLRREEEEEEERLQAATEDVDPELVMHNSSTLSPEEHLRRVRSRIEQCLALQLYENVGTVPQLLSLDPKICIDYITHHPSRAMLERKLMEIPRLASQALIEGENMEVQLPTFVSQFPYLPTFESQFPGQQINHNIQQQQQQQVTRFFSGQEEAVEELLQGSSPEGEEHKEEVNMLKQQLIILRRIKLQKLKSFEREMEPLRNAIVCSGSNRDKYHLKLVESSTEYLKWRMLQCLQSLPPPPNCGATGDIDPEMMHNNNNTLSSQEVCLRPHRAATEMHNSSTLSLGVHLRHVRSRLEQCLTLQSYETFCNDHPQLLSLDPKISIDYITHHPSREMLERKLMEIERLASQALLEGENMEVQLPTTPFPWLTTNQSQH